MLLLIAIILLVTYRRRWYGYGSYWGYPGYRGYGPYSAASYGYVWNGYAWQPRYFSNYGTGYVPNYGYGWGSPYYGRPYGFGYYQRPYWW